MSKTFVLLLLLGTALAATQVNISIAQHPAPAGVTYVDGKAPAELRAGPAERGNHRVEDAPARPAQLRAADKAANFEYEDSHTDLNSGAQDAGYSSEGRSARLQAGGDLAHIQQLQQQGFSDRVTYSHSGNSNARPQQLQQQDEQDKQNQEFERYIKSYHSGGPTVETVFESANPTAKHYQQPSPATSAAYYSASSAGGAPARIVAIRPQSKQLRTFERQVALPAVAALSGDANHQTKSSDSVDGQQVSSLPSSSGTSYTSGAAPSNIPYNASPSQSQAAVGYDQPDYGQRSAYNKPDFEQPLFSYDAAPQTDLYNQYPAPVDPAQAAGYEGYGGNFDQGNFYGGSVAAGSVGGYHPAQPPYQRRVITKTIQIAQPALKARKYEVRHPAIQREFYDIEERVVIKPAGTIVVELERPVAKIAKGETILPLGHPHPAVASAYNQPSSNGFGSLSSSSGYTTPNNQYNSGFLQSAKAQNVLRPSTVASTITANPTYDSNSKDAFVEHNLNRQYDGGFDDPQFVANTEHSYNEAKPNNQDLQIMTNQDNQRKISSKDITPNVVSKDESDLSYPVQVPQAEVKYNGAPAPAPTTYVASPQSYGAGEPQFIATTERSYNEAKPNDQDFLIITDAQGNQRKISSKNITPNMLSKDESDLSYPVQAPQAEVKYNGAQTPAPTTYAASSQSFSNYNNNNKVEQAAAAPSNRRFQANFNDNNQYQGEYLPAEYNNANNQQDYRPARLQQAPVRSETKSSAPASNEPEITHEHNIHLPGMQHNIYLQRSEQSPPEPQRRAHSRYEEEVARVLEIKPYLRHQPQRFEPQRYTQSGREQPGGQQYRAQLRNDAEDASRVHYSAPYSHMRYLPQESAQLKSAAAYADEQPAQARNQKLILTQKNQDNQDNGEASSSGKSVLRPLTHIQIQFPQQPKEAAVPNVVVSSTISPTQERQQRVNYDADKLDSASDLRRGDQEYATKLDCDQPTQFSARYENVPLFNNPQQSRGQQKFQRIIQASNVSADADGPSSANVVNIAPDAVDNGVKSTSGHIPTGGSRVIAATAASTDSSAANESFHKRRIVVNHPFQTVREVVEHEPITNYHQVQVNEPALPAGPYDQAAYFETHDAPRQAHADSTHSHLRYSAPAPYPAAFRQNHRA